MEQQQDRRINANEDEKPVEIVTELSLSEKYFMKTARIAAEREQRRARIQRETH